MIIQGLRLKEEGREGGREGGGREGGREGGGREGEEGRGRGGRRREGRTSFMVHPPVHICMQGTTHKYIHSFTHT